MQHTVAIQCVGPWLSEQSSLTDLRVDYTKQYSMIFIYFLNRCIFMKLPFVYAATFVADALYILYPGLYVAGGVFFLLTVFSLQRDKRRLDYKRMTDSVTIISNDD